MILASINTKNEIISMLSIPRDLYVEYGSGQDGRINRIYETYLNKSESEEIGMIAIADKVSQLTGQKIDFFVNIDFQ
jgi:anionic cell wall polymer biosynthesis LytR-Cps2A-Psr (LCP) family protein